MSKETLMKSFAEYEVCPVCFGEGGAIGDGVEQPCHSGPYSPNLAVVDNSCPKCFDNGYKWDSSLCDCHIGQEIAKRLKRRKINGYFQTLKG